MRIPKNEIEWRLKKLESHTTPIDWSKVKIYTWENTPEEFEELARHEAAGGNYRGTGKPSKPKRRRTRTPRSTLERY